MNLFGFNRGGDVEKVVSDAPPSRLPQPPQPNPAGFSPVQSGQIAPAQARNPPIIGGRPPQPSGTPVSGPGPQSPPAPPFQRQPRLPIIPPPPPDENVASQILRTVSRSTQRQDLPLESPEVRRIMERANDLMTSERGPVRLSALQKERTAFLASGIFLYCKAFAVDDHVISESRGIIRRAGHSIRVEYGVDLEVIAKLYDKLEKPTDIDVNYSQRASYSAIDADSDLEGAILDFLHLIDRCAKGRYNDLKIHCRANSTEVYGIRDDETERFLQREGGWGRRLIAAVEHNAEHSGGQRMVGKHQESRIAKGKKVQLPVGVEGLRLQFNALYNDEVGLVVRLFFSTSDVDENVDIATLGYLREHADALETAYRAPYGVILVSGPTGSGKSTTTRTVISMLRRSVNDRANIVTVENPQEVPIPGALSLRVDGGFTREEKRAASIAAMNAALRDAPRVLFFGEVRDGPETDILFTGGRSGHLCLTTTHANTALDTIPRLVGEGASKTDFMDPSMIVALVGQRLAKKLCKHCRLPFAECPDERLKARTIECFAEAPEYLEHIYFRNPDGCTACDMRGTKGRQICGEVVTPDEDLLKIAVNDGIPQARKFWVQELDGFPMQDHALLHLMTGTIAPDAYEDKMGPMKRTPRDRIEAIERRGERNGFGLFSRVKAAKESS